MTETSIAPDVSSVEIPIDQWSEPFWVATKDHRLVLPRCGDCGTFRWPPGPFCPSCRSQAVDWQPAGPARIFSFAVVRGGSAEAPLVNIPTLIEFPDAGGIRLLAPLVEALPDAVTIGATVEPVWHLAANAVIPGFRLQVPNGTREG